jgi:uncharacterized phage protein gp47/JayE
MSTYITSTGAQIPTYDEIKTELESDFQNAFGDNIDLSAQSVFGQLIAIFAKYISNNFLMSEEIYTARNPQDAEGTNLDFISDESGVSRLPAIATQVLNANLYGDLGTVILTGKLAKSPDQSEDLNYSLQDDVTIDNTIAIFGRISLSSVSGGTTYTVTIDTISYQYTAIGGDTVNDVMTAIETAIEAGSWSGKDNTIVNSNDELEISDTVSFDYSVTNLTIEETGNQGDFICVLTGANSMPANAMTQIVTPVTGWTRVDNPSSGILGSDIESDSDFRIRRKRSVSGIGNATDESIRSNILNDVDNVTAVTVVSNRTDLTDGENRPPHSFEAIIRGGDDTEIAEKIWEVQPSGIQSTGNINSDGSVNPTIPGSGITIQDSQGTNQLILFSRPTDVFIFVRVKRDLYDEETYPANGDEAIKQAIVDWSLEPDNIDVGKDVIRQRLSTPVYTVEGIEDILIELDSSDTLPYTPTYTANNIDISDRELAIFSTSRIVVENLTP